MNETKNGGAVYCEGKSALCGEQRCPQEKCEHYNGAGAYVVRREGEESEHGV